LETHRVFLLLALFNVVVMALGLFLNQQLLDVYRESVHANQQWESRLTRYLDLQRLAANVDAPGNNLFETKNVRAESRRFSDARRVFEARLSQLHQGLSSLRQADRTALGSDFLRVGSLMGPMASGTRRIFDLYGGGDTAGAAAEMAAVNRSYGQLTLAFDRLRSDVADIQRGLLRDQSAHADDVQWSQRLMAGLVAIMIGAALLYARKLRKESETAERETEQHIAQLEATQKQLRVARDDLEIRVAERTQELLRANTALRDESEQRLRTIAEVQRAHAVLDRQARRLSESNRDLQEFAYVASHDLQEPLRKILAFSDRLGSRLGDDLDDTARDYIDRLRNAATRMQKLIDDLLVFSRVQTQGDAHQRADLDEIVRSVVGDLEIAIEESGTTVSVGTLPTIEADPSQMRQLFQNLIGNAMKFRQDGVKPMIAVAGGVEDSEEGPVCVITVADNGIGFAPEHAEKIFTVFQRLHGRGEYEGSGIGLAVTRRVAERHGGTIQATGRPGHGATFVIRIPAVQPTQEETSDDRAQRTDALVGR
jgi:signal transduction histidine kinase